MKKQFKNILKINLIIGKKQNLVMREKESCEVGEKYNYSKWRKKMSLNKKE